MWALAVTVKVFPKLYGTQLISEPFGRYHTTTSPDRLFPYDLVVILYPCALASHIAGAPPEFGWVQRHQCPVVHCAQVALAGVAIAMLEAESPRHTIKRNNHRRGSFIAGDPHSRRKQINSTSLSLSRAETRASVWCFNAVVNRELSLA